LVLLHRTKCDIIRRMNTKENSGIQNTEDTKYIHRAINNDGRAFEHLVKKYEHKIYDLAYKILGNTDDAADVLQETFLQAYRSLPKFKGKSSFSTWLYRIAMNNCLMKIRKHKNRTVESLDSTEDDSTDALYNNIPDWSFNPEATAENSELRDILSRTIRRLPSEYRTVIILHDMQGMSNKEVSGILKLSIPAIKSRLHRARSFVRKRLSHYFVQKTGKPLQ